MSYFVGNGRDVLCQSGANHFGPGLEDTPCPLAVFADTGRDVEFFAYILDNIGPPGEGNTCCGALPLKEGRGYAFGFRPLRFFWFCLLFQFFFSRRSSSLMTHFRGFKTVSCPSFTFSTFNRPGENIVYRGRVILEYCCLLRSGSSTP